MCWGWGNYLGKIWRETKETCLAKEDPSEMQHWIFPRCFFEKRNLWRLETPEPDQWGPDHPWLTGGWHSLRGPTLYPCSYNTDDVTADGDLPLESIPLGCALSQQLRSPAIVLLLGRDEAALENIFALTGFSFDRIDMPWLSSELVNSTCTLKNKMKTRKRFERLPLTHTWPDSPLFLLRRQMWCDRVPFIT